jgi:hypothetical protein
MPIPKWGMKELGISAETLKGVQLAELCPPPDMRRECVIIEGASPEEKAGKLATVFKELR